MEVSNEIRAVVNDLLYQYASAIIDKDHSASGNLVLKSDTIIKWNKGSFTVDFVLQDYWKYLEYGTKPHFPPMNKIEEWIRVKPVVPYAIDGRVPTTKQLAYLISRKISEVGTQPTHLLEETLDSNEELIDKLCDLIMDKIIEQLDD